MDLPALIPIIIVVLYLISSIKILAEYERGVIFRLGRVLRDAQGPRRGSGFLADRPHGAHVAAGGGHGGSGRRMLSRATTSPSK